MFGVAGCASAQQTTASQTVSTAQKSGSSSSTLPAKPAPGAKPAAAKNEYNYAEALQKSLFFFEAQQSGHLSPGNRVEWRGPAHVEDGKDVGRDLTGGWYDAGDHWKSNHTMAFAATNLAWSVVQFPEAYRKTGQMDEVLDNIKHVTDYFLRCTVDPNLTNLSDFSRFELYMDIGNRIGPQPAVHSVWSAPEATGGFPLRESLKVNKDVPGADSAACMAATLGAAAIAFHENGNAAQKTYAQQLLRTARKLFAFAEAFPTVKKNDKNEVVAIAPDGALRHVEYRSDQVRDELYFAAGWLQRAESRLATPGYDNRYLNFARDLTRKVIAKKDEGGLEVPVWEEFGWWKDYFPGNYQHGAQMVLLQAIGEQKVPTPWNDVAQIWDSNLWAHVKAWAELEATPFGLRVRDVYRGLNIKWTMNETFIAALYSAHTAEAQRREKAFDFAKSQMNYVLGDNFYNKSFMVGFGKDWFKTLHSRIAHGAWAGFAHINSNSPLYMPEMRHTQYGALLAGPNGIVKFQPQNGRPDEMVKAKWGKDAAGKEDWTGEFEPATIVDHTYYEVTIEGNSSATGVLAALVSRNPDAYKPLPANQFPVKEVRNNNTDLLTTDREFFAEARVEKQDDTSVQINASVHNRTRWPARMTDKLSMRYFFTLDGGATPADITVRLDSSEGGKIGPLTKFKGNVYFVEVDFSGEQIYPNRIDSRKPAEQFRRNARFTISAPSKAKWNTANDWSFQGLGAQPILQPKIAIYNAGKLVGGEEPR
jgi:predicted hotdog family 3-hydroxylacyl-ACP dehydratase